MKKSLKVTIGIVVSLCIVGGIFGASVLTDTSKNNITNSDKDSQSKNVTTKSSTVKKETHSELQNDTSTGVSESNNTLQSENNDQDTIVTNPQGGIVEGNTDDRISKVNFDRTNNTEAARIVKSYYQSIGQDSDNLTYSGYKADDGYEVRVVDTMLKKQGGTGTVDLLRVDKDNNVTHVN